MSMCAYISGDVNVLVRVSIVVIKQKDEKQLGKKGVCFTSQLWVHH